MRGYVGSSSILIIITHSDLRADEIMRTKNSFDFSVVNIRFIFEIAE